MKRSTLNKIISLLFVLSAGLAPAQPPEPIAAIESTLEPGYFFMVPFKMSNRNATPFSYLMVLNEKAELVLYKKVKAASNLRIQPNGLISYYAGDKFYLFNKGLSLLDSAACVNGAVTDPHDFLVLNNGHYLLLGWEVVTEDCSDKKIFLNKNCGGSRKASVKYGLVQELDQNKKLVYEWKSRNNFSVENADPYFLMDTLNVDLTHFNSIDIDDAGNFMVSARYFNEIFKVERKSGKILWHFGGKNNTLKVMNDTLPFYGQHDARFAGRNRITLFDNGYTAAARRHNARALEYKIDAGKKTATLTWKYANNEYTVSKGTGNVQKLAGGNVLVNYGQVENGIPNNSFEVVSERGKKLIAVHFKDTIGTYRAFFYSRQTFDIPGHQVVQTTFNGQMMLELDSPHKFYQWNTGDTSSAIRPKGPGTYYVFFSDDSETFTRSEIFRYY